MKSLNRPLTYFVILGAVVVPLSLQFRAHEIPQATIAKRAPASVGAAVPMERATTVVTAPMTAKWVRPTNETAFAEEKVVAPMGTEELREYMKLSAKVLASDEDRQRKLELLEDPNYLKAIGRILQEGTDDRMEAAAIQSLLEARKYGQSETAELMLQELVSDARVEDVSLSSSERERLAATKAEVMYLWSASSQDVATKIPQLLPGDVSERLWRNVRTLQEENQVASAGIEERYTRTGSHLTE